MKEIGLPVLDIRLAQKDPAEFREQLRKACHLVGFFLLRHDIPNWKDELREVRQFFSRSREEKMTISYGNSRNFRGYMHMGAENTSGIIDLREQVELATEENEIHRDWPPYERLRGSNPWPSCQPSLKATTLAYISYVKSIAETIRDSLCAILGLDDSAVNELFGIKNPETEKPHWMTKLVAYPPVQSLDEPASVYQSSLGVGAHTDTNFLTIILQDNMGGLQVFTRGAWMDVPAEDGFLVCNLGEQAEILSQGYFCATPHRVLPNTKEISRISVPFFYNALLSATISPYHLSDQLTRERTTQKGDDARWRRSQNALFNAVGDNIFKGYARSHPLVFHRYHADLHIRASDGCVVKRADEHADSENQELPASIASAM